MNERRIEQIRTSLTEALNPVELAITDESHKHVGHAGAKSGMGHFHVRIVAEQFQGLSLVGCHRLVYSAVADLMDTEIHALSIDAAAPNEH